MADVGDRQRAPVPLVVRQLRSRFDLVLYWGIAVAAAFGFRFVHPAVGPASHWLAIGVTAAAPVTLLVTLWMVLREYRRIQAAVVAASGRAGTASSRP